MVDWNKKAHVRAMEAAWRFDGNPPSQVKKGDDSTSKSKRRQSSEPMHYYCSMPKVGKLRHETNFRPHVDYTVSPKLVATQFSQGKLRWGAVVEEFAFCFSCIKSNLLTTKAYKEYMTSMMLREKRRVYREALRSSLSGFVRIIPMDEWRKQFEVPQERHSSLVLDGETKTGKSQFAMWVFNCPERTLVVNCSGTDTEPDLRPYVEGEHRVILFLSLIHI